MAAGLVFIVVYLNYVVIPVSKTSAKIQLANRAIFAGRFEQAHNLLERASEDDPLSSEALSLNSKLYLHHFKLTSSVNRDLLLAAEKKSLGAIEANSAAFKNYERLTEVYILLADISKEQEKTDWLNKAFDNTSFTVEHLYPGCARLRIELAKVSDLLGKTDIAISQYEKAIEIEDESVSIKGKVIYCNADDFGKFRTGIQFLETNKKILSFVINLLKTYSELLGIK